MHSITLHIILFSYRIIFLETIVGIRQNFDIGAPQVKILKSIGSHVDAIPLSAEEKQKNTLR